MDSKVQKQSLSCWMSAFSMPKAIHHRVSRLSAISLWVCKPAGESLELRAISAKGAILYLSEISQISQISQISAICDRNWVEVEMLAHRSPRCDLELGSGVTRYLKGT